MVKPSVFLLFEKEKRMRHPYPGMFVVCEGINGCGKSAQAIRLYNWLRSIQVAVVLTKEPTTGFVGQQIRQALKDPALLKALGPTALQSWYALDSRQHVQEVVIPALKRGEVVISDRYRPSLVHSAVSVVNSAIIALLELNARILKEDFLTPELTLIFDVEPSVAMARLEKKGVALDAQETLPEMSRTRECYLLLSKIWPGSVVIDAGGEEKDVFVQAQNFVASLLHLSA